MSDPLKTLPTVSTSPLVGQEVASKIINNLLVEIENETKLRSELHAMPERLGSLEEASRGFGLLLPVIVNLRTELSSLKEQNSALIEKVLGQSPDATT